MMDVVREEVDGGLKLQMSRCLLEYHWVQHDVVEVMRDVHGERFCVKPCIRVELLHGDFLQALAILSE